eukprot:358702-Rhodomonas_salina.2
MLARGLWLGARGYLANFVEDSVHDATLLVQNLHARAASEIGAQARVGCLARRRRMARRRMVRSQSDEVAGAVV